MPSLPHCQVCGSADRRPFACREALELFECLRCALVWLDPMPDHAAMAAYYNDLYQGATGAYFAKVDGKLRRSRGRVRQMLRHLPNGPEGCSFLDVGSNGGFMAEAALAAGFGPVVGVEPDPVSVAYARQHHPAAEYVEGLLEQADLGGRRFSAVYCSEVLEHTADVNRFMAALAAATAPGGLLYLTTPDIGHWRRPRDVRRWDSFDPPMHCVYFNRRNLRLLLEKHGFAVEGFRFAWKPGIKVFARRRAET